MAAGKATRQGGAEVRKSAATHRSRTGSPPAEATARSSGGRTWREGGGGRDGRAASTQPAAGRWRGQLELCGTLTPPPPALAPGTQWRPETPQAQSTGMYCIHTDVRVHTQTHRHAGVQTVRPVNFRSIVIGKFLFRATILQVLQQSSWSASSHWSNSEERHGLTFVEIDLQCMMRWAWLLKTSMFQFCL